MSLRQKAIRGVKWTTFSAVLVTALQVVQISILTRFLTPSDFGLMSIVMVVVGFSQAFLDMGISNAIIQKQNISPDQLSTLYWINILSGCIIFLAIASISPLLALFYNEPSLTNLIILTSLSFLIQPFGQQYMILLQKELLFKEISFVEVVNKIVTFIVSVGLAYFGYGVYALVYGTLVGLVVQTIQFVLLGYKDHKPALVFKLSETKEFLSFGMYQMGEKTVNYFNSQVDIILIGKIFGSETLGIYGVAKQLIIRPAQLINPIITRVTFPTMSKIQEDTEALKRIYLKTINYLSSVNFPIYAFIAVFASDIVHILFGEKWLEAVPILQILSIYAAIRSTANPVGSLLLAKGRANWSFYWNLVLLLILPALILISSKWGLVGISWGLVGVMILLIIPNWYFLVKALCGAQFLEYHWQIMKPMLISFAFLIAAYFITLGGMDNNFRILYITTSGVLVYFVLNYFFNKNFIITLWDLKK